MDGSSELWRYEMENNKELTDIPEGENVGSIKYDEAYIDNLTGKQQKNNSDADKQLLDHVNRSLGNQKIEY